MDLWLWSVLLLVLGIGFLILDVFVPSGGLLATLCAACVIASIVVGFMSGPLVGLGVLLGAAVAIPAVIATAVNVWPHTPIGKLILIQRPDHPDDVLPESETYRALRSLIGKQGRAKSKMLPSGSVIIDDRVYDAISEGMAVDPGQPVQVVAIRTNRIIVRPISEEQVIPSAASDDPLAQPVESFGLESLDDPLA